MRPTTVLMPTVFPSSTRISARVPATGEGISVSTLSVEISKRGSSRSTLSPGFFSHFIVDCHVYTASEDGGNAEYDHVPGLMEQLERKTRPLPVECVVRGYLAGSGWREYQQSGTVCGEHLPPGLPEAGKLPQPIFTPATKAEAGHHDENITFEKTVQEIGRERAEEVRARSVAIYQRARAMAEQHGIIIADTKMEFGVLREQLILIDELLTPDSSRFWPKSSYQTGGSPPSFDKQYLRDYLLSIQWNKQPPAPDLPEEVVRTTSAKYVEVLEMLTGMKIEEGG